MIRNKFRSPIIIIAIMLALFMFFGNRYVSEAQSARHFLKWTVDCAKGVRIWGIGVVNTSTTIEEEHFHLRNFFSSPI